MNTGQGFMRGVFNFKHFLDTPDEWHAFAVGIGDGYAFTRTAAYILMCWGIQKTNELHYYKVGVFSGRVLFAVTLGILWMVFT